MAVDIGAEAVDRTGSRGGARTYINTSNSATKRGLITSIDIWAAVNITGLRVGTFYTTNGDTLKCRASGAIAGTITAGSKVVKAVSIAVEIGDYIGCYMGTGSIEYVGTGFAGMWRVEGEYIDPNDEAAYTFYAGDVMSLGGFIPPTPVADGDLIGIPVIRKS